MKTRELYSVEEARSLLGGISRVTIYDILNSGELSSVTIGCRRLIPAVAITAFIATASTNTAPSIRRATGRCRSPCNSSRLPNTVDSAPHYRAD